MIQVILKQCVDAYNALTNLSSQPFLLSDSRKLLKTMKALRDEVDFYGQESEKLLNRYSPRISEGRVLFDKTEDRDAFDASWSELESMTVDLELDKIIIHLSQYENRPIVISPDDLTALESFLEIDD